MENTEPEFDNWKDAYEWHSQQSYEQMKQFDEEALVGFAKNGAGGLYFQLWRALGEKGTVKVSAMPLFEYVRDNPGEDAYLDRYHAFEALEKVLERADGKKLSEDEKFNCVMQRPDEGSRQEALNKIKERIEKLS
jgi:hypothetical protein